MKLPPPLMFHFGDSKAQYVRDMSMVWDAPGLSSRRHDAPVEMLGHLESYLKKLANADDSLDRLRHLIGLLVETQTMAVVWRRLLRVGASLPVAAGRLLLPMTASDVILISLETETEVGNYLRAIFPKLGKVEREEIETAIMRTPDSNLLQHRDPADRTKDRDRLLGCLNLEDLVTEAARLRLSEMLETETVPPNEPTFRCWSEHRSATEEERWGWRGIPYDDRQSVEYRRLAQAATEFKSQYENAVPELSAILHLTGPLDEMYQAICGSGQPELHSDLVTSGLDLMAECCQAFLRNSDVFSEEHVIDVVKRILLSGAEHPVPRFSAETNAQFDRGPSWERPAPRIEAAQGLVLLASDSRGATDEVLAAIEKLAGDPVNAVRYIIAKRLYYLDKIDNKLMWKLIDILARSETSTGVLFALVDTTLDSVLRSDRQNIERILVLMGQIRDRVGDKIRDTSSSVNDSIFGHYVNLYLHEGNQTAERALFVSIADLKANHPELLFITTYLREILDERTEIQSRAGSEVVRRRAWKLINDICDRATSAIRELNESFGKTPATEIPEAVKATYRELVTLLDGLAMELCFASEANEERRENRDEGEGATREWKTRFWSKASSTLTNLADIGLAPVAHHLVELLKSYIDVVPKEAFVLFGRIVEKSRSDGYQYESMARTRLSNWSNGILRSIATFLEIIKSVAKF